MHLYELTNQFKALEALADADEIPPEVLRDTIDALEGEWHAKAINVAAFIKNLEATASNIKQAAAAMTARQKRYEARAESLKQYLLFQCQAMGVTKIDSDPRFDVSVRDNPASVVIDNLGDIPTQYMVYPVAPPPHPDKKAILDDIKAGVEVPGVHTEQGQRLEIRA